MKVDMTYQDTSHVSAEDLTRQVDELYCELGKRIFEDKKADEELYLQYSDLFFRITQALEARQSPAADDSSGSATL